MTEEDTNMRLASYYQLRSRAQNGTVPAWQLVGGLEKIPKQERGSVK